MQLEEKAKVWGPIVSPQARISLDHLLWFHLLG